MTDLTDLLSVEFKGRTVPVARNEFEEAVEPPFIVFVSESPDIMGADNIVWHMFNNYRIELYTSKKEGALEEMLEERFRERRIFFEKEGDIKISSENLWMVVYYI